MWHERGLDLRLNSGFHAVGSYTATKANLQEAALGVPPEEKLLWHGTRSVDPQIVATDPTGLDPRLGRPGSFLGRGVYVAENPL